jgi:hypothetical protein
LENDSSPRYGERLDWTGYSGHNAGHILLLYLEQLPEPIVPPSYYERFCEPLRKNPKLAAYALPLDPREERDPVQFYQDLIDELPPVNRHIFLYILTLLDVLSSKLLSHAGQYELAALFQPVLLMDHHYPESHLNQDVLIFLLTHPEIFFLYMPGTAIDDKPVSSVEDLTDTTEPREPAPQDTILNMTLAEIPPPRDIATVEVRNASLPTVLHLYDINELDEPAPRNIPPNRTLVKTLFTHDITPADVSSGSLLALDTSGWQSGRETSTHTACLKDRTETQMEFRKGSPGSDSTKDLHPVDFDVKDDWVPFYRPIIRPDGLAIQDQQSAHDSRLYDEFQSSNIDTPRSTADVQSLTSPSRVQKLEKTSSSKEPDFGRGKEGAVIENVARNRANSNKFANDRVLPEQKNIPESPLKGVKDRSVMRSVEQPTSNNLCK